MRFCIQCGHSLGDGQGACDNCGYLPSVTPTFETFDANAEPVLFSEYKKLNKETKEERAIRRQETAKARKVELKIQMSEIQREFSAWMKKQKRILILVGSGLALLGSLIGTQGIINYLNRPEQLLDYYVDAVKHADWDALDAEELFPAASKQLPDALKSAFSQEAVTEVRYSDVKIVGDKATATIFLDKTTTNSFEISLSSKPSKILFYSIPQWVVTTKAPQVKVVVDSRLLATQTAKLGNSSPQTVSTLRGLVNGAETYSSLPGVFRISVSAAGILKVNDTSQVIKPGISQSTIAISPNKSLNLSSIAVSTGLKKARALASSCAKSKCRAFPKYDVTDFNLWSQYDRSTYTSSRFSYSFALGACSAGEATAVDAYTASIPYFCEITVKAKLYVKYVYYYGYYSDYYYYWNFYDTDTTSISPTVRIKVDRTGTAVVSTTSKLN